MDHRSAGIEEEVDDANELARAQRQREQFDCNSAWLQAHISEIYTNHRGKCICIAGQQLFVGDTARTAIEPATAAHPEDKGSFTRYIEPEYHACIHRFDNLEDYFVYPIQLADPLPEIAVPLLPGDGDVRLDLQAAMNRAYDAGPYRREIDYAQDKITPPLRPTLAKWAKSVVSSRTLARAQKS